MASTEGGAAGGVTSAPPLTSDEIIKRGTNLKNKLKMYAVADSYHDLKSDFKYIYDNIGQIGGPTKFDASTDNVITDSEDNIIKNIFNFPKSFGLSSNITEFNGFFPDSRMNDISGGGSSFQCITGGTSYKWKSCRIAKVQDDKTLKTSNKRDRIWNKTPEELYDWLNVYNTLGIALTIDAQNVPFYERLVEKETRASESQRTIYSLITREGVNDPAGKVHIQSKPDSCVTFVEIEDTAENTHTQTSFYVTPRDESIPYMGTAAPYELFYSKFDISLSCIKEHRRFFGKNVKKVIMEYTTPLLKKQMDIIKGSMEDAHAGAIENVINAIRKLNDFIVGKPKDEIINDNFFLQIQQKRSGDWLQVLSCLDRNRFKNIPDTIKRILLVTHDRICLAYALLMGIDVLYTRYEQTTHEYYLLMFYSNVNPPEPNDILKAEIEEFKKHNKVVGGYKQNKVDYNRNHLAKSTELYKLYTDYINSIRVVETPTQTSRQTQTQKQIQDQITENIKNILKRAMDIGYFLSIAPVLNTSGDDDNFFSTYINVTPTPDISVGDVNTVRTQFAVYRENYQILNKITDVNIFTDARKNKICLDRYKAVDAISIFHRVGYRATSRAGGITSGLFSRKDGDDPRKGAGVFVYLESFLNSKSKQDMVDYMNRISLPDTENQYKLKTFINNVIFLLNVQAPASVPASASASASASGGATAIAFPDVSTSELLETIYISDSKHIPEFGQMDSDKTSVTEMKKIDADIGRFQVSDFTAAHELIAFRANTQLYGGLNALVQAIQEQQYTNAAIQEREVEREAAREAEARGAGAEARGAAAEAEARGAEAAAEGGEDVRLFDEQQQLERLQVGLPPQSGGGDGTRGWFNTTNSGAAACIGSDTCVHNPHTTFYLLLRELSFRLRQEEQYNYYSLVKISSVIYTIYKYINTYKGVHERDVMHHLEYFFMKELKTLHVDYNEIITTFLYGYYGMYDVPESYTVAEIPEMNEIMESIRTLFHEELHDDVNEKTRNTYIKNNLTIMADIIRHVDSIETREVSRGIVNYTRIPEPVGIDTLQRHLVSAYGGHYKHARTSKHKKHKTHTLHKQLYKTKKYKSHITHNSKNHHRTSKHKTYRKTTLCKTLKQHT